MVGLAKVAFNFCEGCRFQCGVQAAAVDTEHEGELLNLTEEGPSEELPALAEAGPGPRAETFSIPDFNQSVKSCGIRKRSFEINSKTVKTHVCRGR